MKNHSIVWAYPAATPPPDYRAEAIAAGEAEYAAWLEELRVDRDSVCVFRHQNFDNGTAGPHRPKRGYFNVCQVCGHNISIPF